MADKISWTPTSYTAVGINCAACNKVPLHEKSVREKVAAAQKRKATREERASAMTEWKRRERSEMQQLRNSGRKKLSVDQGEGCCKTKHRRPGWKKLLLKGLLLPTRISETVET